MNADQPSEVSLYPAICHPDSNRPSTVTAMVSGGWALVDCMQRHRGEECVDGAH